MKTLFCFRGRMAKRSEQSPTADWCVFCDIARRASTSTTALLYSVSYPILPRHIFSKPPFQTAPLCGLLNVSFCWVQDDKVVAFQDIDPSSFRHYLVIPIEHIPTVKNLQRTKEDHQLVSHMVKVGKDLLGQDAPNSEEHRFGFHQPPFNSVDHLHLHCLALPFIPSWRQVKYTPLGPLGGFLEAEKLLETINPQAQENS